jgi:signal transduction histidine kinase
MTPERRALQSYMSEQNLGAMITSGGASLSVVIAVGIRASRRPYTYPEITQLAELCSIFETALARSHYSVKAQHAEQLATVGLLGASLAHEIRNPLVSIKTFVQLLPHHYQDQAFRDKFFRLVGEEVARIDRLTEQLLDLASPRAFNPSEISLHPILEASLELVEAKASEKHVELISAFDADPDTAYADPNAAKQILLNLCFNAIQAIENRPGDRWVKVSTRKIPAGFELAVTDNGPGIPEDVRPRLFQPFQSTKSTGFGLGLAICSDIAAGLGGTISADPAMPGAGATFRVLLPCQRPTS